MRKRKREKQTQQVDKGKGSIIKLYRNQIGRGIGRGTDF